MLFTGLEDEHSKIHRGLNAVPELNVSQSPVELGIGSCEYKSAADPSYTKLVGLGKTVSSVNRVYLHASS